MSENKQDSLEAFDTRITEAASKVINKFPKDMQEAVRVSLGVDLDLMQNDLAGCNYERILLHLHGFHDMEENAHRLAGALASAKRISDDDAESIQTSLSDLGYMVIIGVADALINNCECRRRPEGWKYYKED